MGTKRVEISIIGALSRHNDERDEEEAALWSDLSRRVRELTTDPRYAGIVVDVSSADE